MALLTLLADAAGSCSGAAARDGAAGSAARPGTAPRAGPGAEVASWALTNSLLAQTSARWRLVVVGPGVSASSRWSDARLTARPSASEAASSATEGLVAIVDGRVRLHPEAVAWFAAAFESRPEAVAAYADSTERVSGRLRSVLRPAWNPELALSTRYTGDPFVVTASALAAAREAGWSPGLDEFSRYDLMLQIAEQPGRILHIGAALSHRDHPRTTDPKTAHSAHTQGETNTAHTQNETNTAHTQNETHTAHTQNETHTAHTQDETNTADPADARATAAVAAVQACLDRTGRAAAAKAVPGASGCVVRRPAFGRPPAASVVVPTAAAPDAEGRPLIERCLKSLASTRWPELETILVTGDECLASRAEMASLAEAAGPPARVIRRPAGPFNFSTAVNCGALAARGPLLVLLNDDTELADPLWLARLAVHAVDQGVGAVGPRLLYADGTIQNTGFVLEETRPLHPFAGWDPAEADRRGWGSARTVTAVTGACLMTRRREFLAAGGFTELLPLAFNDIDFCLRLARTGLRTVLEPAAALVHHESQTRSPTVEGWEWNRFARRWGRIADPWYHPGYARPGDPDDPHRDAEHEPPARPPMDAAPRTAEIRRGFRRAARAELPPPAAPVEDRTQPGEPRTAAPVEGGAQAGEPRTAAPGKGGAQAGKPVAQGGRPADTGSDSVTGMASPHPDRPSAPESSAESADPIDSDDPQVLRQEILRLRDALGGARARNSPLEARVAELEELEADRTRLERLLGSPAVRFAIAASRPIRRRLRSR